MASIRMAHKSWLSLLTIMLLLSFSIRAGAETPKAEELLQKMVRSFRTVSFKGKLTFMSMSPEGNQMREALIIRKAPDKGRMELLNPPEERGILMVMNGKKRWHALKGNERGKRRGFRPFLSPNRMNESLLRNVRLLLQNYDLRVFAGGRVADRDTHLIEVESETTVRPAVKFWVDMETGTILKMEHYDSQKRLRDLLVYSEIDFYPEIADAVFEKPEGSQSPRGPGGEQEREDVWNSEQGKLDLKKVRKAARLNVVVPKLAPVGFVLQSIQLIKSGEQKNVHLIYTDGLAMLSVFQSKAVESRRFGRRGGLFRGRREGRRADMPPFRGGRIEKMNISGIDCEVMSRGPMFIFRWNHKDVCITLMGELEREEMIKIASSFINKTQN